MQSVWLAALRYPKKKENAKEELNKNHFNKTSDMFFSFSHYVSMFSVSYVNIKHVLNILSKHVLSLM